MRTPLYQRKIGEASSIRPARRNRATAGFTLVELIISASLMALILVSGYMCLNSGFASQKLIQSRADAVQSARVAMTIMSADLRSACVLSKEFQFLGMHRMLGDIEADNLDFGTHNYTPRRRGEGDFCEVSYFVAPEPQSGKLSIWRRRDPTPDDEPLSGGSREEIARGIRGLQFEYYDGIEWFDEWGDPQGRRAKSQNSALDPPNLTGLPDAVRITIWIDSNSKPQTPRRDTAGGDVAPPASTTDTEPSLAFQTVVRLNLAAAARNSGGSNASNSGSGTEQQEQQQQNTPTGGAQ
jgi:type II secretion system protein J